MEKRNHIFIYLSVFTLIYWLSTKLVAVYDIAVIGAIYELTALIAIAVTFSLPVVILGFWIRHKFSKRYVFPLLISISTIFIMIYFPFIG